MDLGKLLTLNTSLVPDYQDSGVIEAWSVLAVRTTELCWSWLLYMINNSSKQQTWTLTSKLLTRPLFVKIFEIFTSTSAQFKTVVVQSCLKPLNKECISKGLSKKSKASSTTHLCEWIEPNFPERRHFTATLHFYQIDIEFLLVGTIIEGKTTSY